jgi:hypothetical protein
MFKVLQDGMYTLPDGTSVPAARVPPNTYAYKNKLGMALAGLRNDDDAHDPVVVFTPAPSAGRQQGRPVGAEPGTPVSTARTSPPGRPP